MKYTIGTFRATRHRDNSGVTDWYALGDWGGLIDEAERLNGEKCRVSDAGVEGYCDLEFIDGSRLEAVSRGHIF
jgi:hypothetical protein